MIHTQQWHPNTWWELDNSLEAKLCFFPLKCPNAPDRVMNNLFDRKDSRLYEM